MIILQSERYSGPDAWIDPSEASAITGKAVNELIAHARLDQDELGEDNLLETTDLHGAPVVLVSARWAHEKAEVGRLMAELCAHMARATRRCAMSHEANGALKADLTREAVVQEALVLWADERVDESSEANYYAWSSRPRKVLSMGEPSLVTVAINTAKVSQHDAVAILLSLLEHLHGMRATEYQSAARIAAEWTPPQDADNTGEPPF